MSNLARANPPGSDLWYQETNAQTIYVPVVVFAVICPIIVGLRAWARMSSGGRLGIEDYTILISLACALASGGIMLAGCHYGYGKHLTAIPVDDRYQAFKYFYLCQVTYKACINMTKASILLLYLRIFNTTKWLRWSCYFMLTSVASYCIASVTATIFQCTPITKAFDKSMDGTCIDNGRFWYANAGFSITTDLVILTLPMRLVYVLQIPKAQKVALILVFAVGVFVVITSCLRVTTIDIQATTSDPTYDIASTMWTIIEMNVAIVCACLPQIRPLIMKWFPRLMPAYYANSRDSTKRTTYNGGGLPYPSGSSRNHSQPEEGRWTRIGNGTVAQGSTNGPDVRRGDNISEEYMLQDDRGLQIHKTMQYTVEYMTEGKDNQNAGSMA
ncbi:hypothetical protein GGR54DRAFT_467892 [Hypoxylon sp. NC1633]|nr:hypothetical protein GGR54DRAFT_467892 [Hypoxylon sp. NC1633]